MDQTYRHSKQDQSFNLYSLSNRLFLNAQPEENVFNVQNIEEADSKTKTKKYDANIRHKQCVACPTTQSKSRGSQQVVSLLKNR